MTIDRVLEILEAYGADPARWPAAERAAAQALLAQSPELQQAQADAARLDAILDRMILDDMPPLDTTQIAARIAATPQFEPDEKPIATLMHVAGVRAPAAAGFALAAAIAGFVIGWGMPGGDIAADEFAGLLPGTIMEVDPSW